MSPTLQTHPKTTPFLVMHITYILKFVKNTLFRIIKCNSRFFPFQKLILGVCVYLNGISDITAALRNCFVAVNLLALLEGGSSSEIPCKLKAN